MKNENRSLTYKQFPSHVDIVMHLRFQPHKDELFPHQNVFHAQDGKIIHHL